MIDNSCTRDLMPEESSESADIRDDRRDFLRSCGKFAVYTGPAMLLLMKYDVDKASANSGPPH